MTTLSFWWILLRYVLVYYAAFIIAALIGCWVSF